MEKPVKRVLVVSSNRWNSAITEYAISIIKSLQKQDVKVLFVVLKSSAAEARVSRDGIAFESLESFYISGLFRLRRLIAEFKPTVLVTCHGPETMLALLLKSNQRLVRFKGDKRPLKWRRGIDAFLVPNKKIQGYTGNSYCVPLGLERTFSEPIAANKPVVMVLGRLDPVKGHLLALEVFSKLRVQAQLLIVGLEKNTKVEMLHEFAKKCGLTEGDDYQILTEIVADLGALMARASVGFVPSLGSEDIGRVAVEFLQSGVPLLVSDVGGLSEVISSSLEGRSFSLALDSSAVARELEAVIVESLAEGIEIKKRRSRNAQVVFGLETMGKSLLPVIFGEEVNNIVDVIEGNKGSV